MDYGTDQTRIRFGYFKIIFSQSCGFGCELVGPAKLFQVVWLFTKGPSCRSADRQSASQL